MANLILKAAMAYIEKHPEVIEQVIEAAVKMFMDAAKKHQVAQ